MVRSQRFKEIPITYWLALFVVALGFLCLLVARVRLVGLIHHDAGAAEPNGIYGIQTLLRTGRLYHDPSRPPFPVMQYSPLFYYLVAGAAKLGGVDPADPARVYVWSRSAALIFNLCMCGVLVRLVRTFRVPWSAALGIGALGFVYLHITDFGRPDSLYHCLALSTVYWLVRYAQSGHVRVRYLAFAIAAALGALFSKQSGIVFPAIFVSYLLLIERNLRRTLLWGGVYLAGAALLVGLFSWLSGGFFPFWENVHGGIDNGVDFDWFHRRILVFYLRELVGWSVLFFGAAWYFQRNEPLRFGGKPLVVALIWFLPLGLTTSLKWGSMPSYFTPFVFVGFAATAALLMSPSLAPAPDRCWPRFAFSTALMFGTLFEGPVRFMESWQTDESANYRAALEVKQFLVEKAGLQPTDYVLSLIQGGTFADPTFLNQVLYENAILPNKDVVTCCSLKHKRFDYTTFRQQGNAGLVRFIVKLQGNKLNNYITPLTRFTQLGTVAGFDIYQFAP